MSIIRLICDDCGRILQHLSIDVTKSFFQGSCAFSCVNCLLGGLLVKMHSVSALHKENAYGWFDYNAN